MRTENSCDECKREFDQPWKALKLSGAATRGMTLEFCGLACLLSFVTRQIVRSSREKQKAFLLSRPDVPLTDEEVERLVAQMQDETPFVAQQKLSQSQPAQRADENKE